MTDGPYRAEFGAIHHQDATGFLFLVTGDHANAVTVADALNKLEASKAGGGVPDATRAMTARIVAERVRQQTEEGRTPDWDDRHTTGGLARAAACYALTAGGRESKADLLYDPLKEQVQVWWPWDDAAFKPTPADPMRDLERAGALVLAEMERLARS